MKAVFSGACLCGAVSYEGTREPAFAAHCCCEDCRRSSGTGHSSVFLVPSDCFQVSGETRAYRKQADSGNMFTRYFCPVCGTFVFAENSGFPGMTFVRPGTLDDPEVFKPQQVFYASRAPSWVKLDGTLQAFAEMPSRKGRPNQA